MDNKFFKFSFYFFLSSLIIALFFYISSLLHENLGNKILEIPITNQKQTTPK
ncbi:MAG: hypothetical protein UT63_C0015G0011 [Candidatus Gottesmanbacteria bacterium GW2011_GWC2_39_8]|uniref:Uncharacterized protein n=1 Tax=Candidatus Gottesmanbacteria bacterium GW2011_GWC2_39_8 TaxID=1618450 RepID=A0A0G0SFN4_9BACT|nr:MAG: hypothetical protein UT63_C0015G0011 [Candidatus Gottesmanbacteria bacterium GW2011_GWC2_39_8]